MTRLYRKIPKRNNIGYGLFLLAKTKIGEYHTRSIRLLCPEIFIKSYEIVKY